MPEQSVNGEELGMALSISTTATTSFSANDTDMQSAKTRVFSIPELLELILDNIEIPDIMTMFQLSHSMNAFLLGSSKQQSRLPLKASHAMSKNEFPFEACLARMPSSFRCWKHTPGALWIPDHRIQASYSVEYGHRIPLIGSRYKSMYVGLPENTRTC